jgi:hypothetical protein
VPLTGAPWAISARAAATSSAASGWKEEGRQRNGPVVGAGIRDAADEPEELRRTQDRAGVAAALIASSWASLARKGGRHQRRGRCLRGSRPWCKWTPSFPTRAIPSAASPARSPDLAWTTKPSTPCPTPARRHPPGGPGHRMTRELPGVPRTCRQVRGTAAGSCDAETTLTTRQRPHGSWATS